MNNSPKKLNLQKHEIRVPKMQLSEHPEIPGNFCNSKQFEKQKGSPSIHDVQPDFAMKYNQEINSRIQ